MVNNTFGFASWVIDPQPLRVSGLIVKQSQLRKCLFSSDVFLAGSAIIAKTPYCYWRVQIKQKEKVHELLRLKEHNTNSPLNTTTKPARNSVEEAFTSFDMIQLENNVCLTSLVSRFAVYLPKESKRQFFTLNMRIFYWALHLSFKESPSSNAAFHTNSDRIYI